MTMIEALSDAEALYENRVRCGLVQTMPRAWRCHVLPGRWSDSFMIIPCYIDRYGMYAEYDLLVYEQDSGELVQEGMETF